MLARDVASRLNHVLISPDGCDESLEFESSIRGVELTGCIGFRSEKLEKVFLVLRSKNADVKTVGANNNWNLVLETLGLGGARVCSQDNAVDHGS
jgi:hypothetical protein